jgi:tetratricopeptide (TPR) repeat protein
MRFFTRRDFDTIAGSNYPDHTGILSSRNCVIDPAPAMWLASRIRNFVLTGVAACCLHVGAQQTPPPELEQHLRQAQVYIDQENYPAAVRELRAAITLYPEIRGAYYQLGFASFQLGNFAEADKQFTRELQFQPPDPYSLYYLGRIASDAGQRQNALSYFEKCMAAGPVLDVRQRLARTYLALGRLDQAIRLLESSVRERPEDGGLHYMLGRAYRQKGKAPEARAEFEAAARWNAKVRSQMELLTRLHRALETNQQADAVAATRQLADSGDPDVLLATATALGHAGLHQEAIPFLEKTISAQPALAEAHYNLARAYVGLKEAAKAQTELQRAVELKPGFYEAEVLLGTLLAESGRSEEAIPHLRAAVEIRSDNDRVLMMLGLQYFQQRYYPDAIQILEKAVRLDPSEPDPRFLLIQALYRNLEYERALSFALATRDKFPESALAHYHVGAQFSNFGKLPEAREQLEIALRKDPQLREARVMLGDVLFRMGKPEESLVQFRQAVAEDPKLISAHAGAGKALIQLKQYPEAAAAMEQAIRIDPNLASLHLYLSQAYRALGRAEEAKTEAALFSRLNQERAKSRDQDVERKYAEFEYAKD